MTKIIEEIREITAAEVAKKQDVAKLNFPKLVEIIKLAAAKGESSCTVPESQMNEFDRQLLQQEGFNVNLTDALKDRYDAIAQYSPINRKIWVIKW